MGGLVGTVFGALGALFLGVAVGLALGITTYLRRRGVRAERARARMATTGL